MSEQDSGQQRSDRRDEAEEMARLQEQINNLPVGEHILYMMHSLSALAVDRLGLAPEGADRRDVEQARLAIDAFRALLGVLEEARPTEEIAAHRGVLSQLQLAYVGALGGAEIEPDEQQPEGEASGESPAEEARPETQTEEEPEMAEEPAVEAVSKDESEAKEKPKKTSAKKPSKQGKPSKPGSSAGGSAKKSSGTGAGKSAKKGSGESASGSESAGKGEK